MSAVDIILERETANDESALIVAVYSQSGDPVEHDQLLFETENSKATQELRAPHAGIVVHHLEVGQTVEFGVAIARIVSEEYFASTRTEGITPVAVAHQNGNGSHGGAGSAPASMPIEASIPQGRRLAEPRFSQAAAAMVLEYGLTAAEFDADFVTTQDVRSRLGWQKQPQPLSLRPAERRIETAQGAKQGQSLARRKRVEIETLSQGAGETMLSVLGVSLGPLPLTREPGDLLNGRITDLVIYEAARLLRKFPRLNSYFADGQIFEHEGIHAGLAIDGGGNLVVYGIENADQVSLRNLSNLIGDAVARYMDNELTAAEMTRATFTVTDLSADELDFVLPLLPRGQCLILGITHTELLGFRLFAGFDHRVTEGREVAIFLGELRERLLSFASMQGAAHLASHCVYCDRSVDEAVLKGKDKGLLKIVGRDGREVLCCASCWNGW